MSFAGDLPEDSPTQTCWKVLTREDGSKRRCHQPAVNVPACFDLDVSTPAGWPRCEEHLTVTGLRCPDCGKHLRAEEIGGGLCTRCGRLLFPNTQT